MTDNRTNEPTPEQILVDEWIRQADRAKSMTGMDAIWFPDAKETLAVLRANGLLSEGTPSEEHPEFCYCGQILKREDKIDFYTLKCPKLQCGGFRMVPKRSAGVASQEVIDDAADEQDDLRLHMLAPQEPCREIVCDCRGWFGVSPVLPSSGVDEDALAEAWEAGCLAGGNRKHHTNMTEEQAEKAWPNPYREGQVDTRG